MKPVSALLIFVFILLNTNVLGQTPELVKDINKNIRIYSAHSSLTKINNTLFFAGDDGTHGIELWKTDGTTTGTVLVKDIQPNSKDTQGPKYLTNLNGTLYFVINDGIHGDELWKSDGTEMGTIMVKDINPLPGVGSDIDNLVNINGTLFFGARSNYWCPLWKSDGTESGTVPVNELNCQYPRSITNVNGTIFFIGSNNTGGGDALWKSDGTDAGTVMVKNFNTSVSGSGYYNLFNYNGTLFFRGYSYPTGWELWKSDGTETGTILVKDIFAGMDSGEPEDFIIYNNSLFFTVKSNNGNSQRQLWKTDGSETGTQWVKDIPQGFYGSPNYKSFAIANNLLYFTSGGLYDTKVWKSDGTTMGTVLLDAPYPTSYLVSPKFGVVNQTLFFSAGNKELWKTDGTNTGTIKIKDVEFSDAYSNLYAELNSSLFFFSIGKDSLGYELWKSDGTETGTFLLKDINQSNESSEPNFFTVVNSEVYFRAIDNSSNYGLWKTNGTLAGTTLVNGFGYGTASSLTNVNGTLFFEGDDIFNGSNRKGLWKINTSGTQIIKVFNDNYYSLNNLFNVNGTLFFTKMSSSFGNELWTSDGTEAGTKMVKDIFPGDNSSSPESFTSFNNSLYFSAYDGTHYFGLWKSDGTETGTSLVKHIAPSITDYWAMSPSCLTVANGELFFCATDAYGRHLWKTNGTESGTVKVKDVNIRKVNIYNDPFFIDINSTLYFFDGISGLWKSNGTDNGTTLITYINAINNEDIINPVPFPSYINLNGILTFTNKTPNEGEELWKTNGTAAGTVLIKDINFGSNNSRPADFIVHNGVLYFTADDGIHGRELWKTDGTTEGTMMIIDLIPGATGSMPSKLTKVDNTIIFKANGGEGVEVWKLAFSPCPQNLTLSSTNNPTDDVSSGIVSKIASAGTGGFITANNKITGTANVSYQARTITLNPGFKAENGSVFKAETGGCL